MDIATVRASLGRPNTVLEERRPRPAGFSQDRTTFPGWGPKL